MKAETGESQQMPKSGDRRLSRSQVRRRRPTAVARFLPASSSFSRGERGSAIVFVMLTVCVLSVVAASLLLTNVSRYQTTFQSASWQEAIVGSEAGVDLAMNELRKRVVTGPAVSFQTNWTTTNPQTGKPYPNYGHAFPGNNLPYQIATHSGEGNTAMQVRMFVDVPGADAATNFAQPNDTSYISQLDNPNLRDPDGVDRSRWLFRVKSLGITGLTGPARPNLNKYDNLLRRFSFFNDWRTGRTVTTPQVARMVETVASPETGFRNALMASVKIDLSNQDVLIDSYDSSKGVYSSAVNHGQMGNIATNGQLINASHATVEGNALTNNGTVTNGDKVTGQQSSNFYEELTPLTTAMLNPGWSNVPDGGTVTTSTTYTASADANNPALVRLDGINLPTGSNIININAATSVSTAGGTAVSTPLPSYIKIYVNGDLSTIASSFINVDPNVSVIIYVSGNVNLQGVGIMNNSYLASHLLINGIQPTANADGTFPARSVAIATSQDFEGIVYAPNHDLSLALIAVAASGATGSGSSYDLSQILSLQGQIIATSQDLAGNQIAYAQDSAKSGVGNAQKAAQDLAQINADTATLAQLNQELAVFQGTAGPVSSAADHALGYNGIYGGFVANTITVASKTHVHYDETLRTAGPVNHYEIVNWFEDNLSHDAAGGAEAFWWPTP